jgi:uncharacterized Zn-finger protein
VSVCRLCDRPWEDHKGDFFKYCPDGQRFNKYTPKYNTDGTFDTSYQDVPVCPWCGHDYDPSDNDHPELYEDIDDLHEVDCSTCEKTFHVQTIISRAYTATKPKGTE